MFSRFLELATDKLNSLWSMHSCNVNRLLFEHGKQLKFNFNKFKFWLDILPWRSFEALLYEQDGFACDVLVEFVVVEATKCYVGFGAFRVGVVVE